MKELIQKMSECKNELQNLKSIVLSENRVTRRSSANINLSTPTRNKTQLIQQSVSTIIKKNINTPPRSQSVTSTRILLKDVKSSGYGQLLSAIATPKRSLRK